MNAPLVRLRSLQKSYVLGETRVKALQGVDLDIYASEFTAILGTSGSGKSTLLNLIAGIDSADSGEIWFEERRLDGLLEAELAHFRNEKLGFVFQSFNLIPVLTVFENVELPLLVQTHIKKKEREQRVELLLQKVGLADFSKHRPGKLSGGQRQRTAIARALVTSPRIVLADEPTANLDSKTAHQVIDLMEILNSELGVTFLFSTHDEKLIGRVKRRVNIQDGMISES